MGGAIELTQFGFSGGELGLQSDLFGFPERSNLEIEHVKFCARLLNLHFRGFNLLRQGCNFSFAAGYLRLEFVRLLLGLLELKHRLPLFFGLHFDPEFFVLLRFGAILREAIALINQFALNNAIAIFTVLHSIKLLSSLNNFAIERRHPRQLINNLAPLARIHGNNPRHIPLQHYVVAFRIDSQPI